MPADRHTIRTSRRKADTAHWFVEARLGTQAVGNGIALKTNGGYSDVFLANYASTDRAAGVETVEHVPRFGLEHDKLQPLNTGFKYRFASGKFRRIVIVVVSIRLGK